MCGRGLFLERGEGPVGEKEGEGLSTFFYLFFCCITGIKIVFRFWFFGFNFSKMLFWW